MCRPPHDTTALNAALRKIRHSQRFSAIVEQLTLLSEKEGNNLSPERKGLLALLKSTGDDHSSSGDGNSERFGSNLGHHLWLLGRLNRAKDNHTSL
uniref:Uncharacterized protein n=1 Tax=Plectus sambesii TaxID=2011161 RepID=A0A914X585_9BILA